MAFSEIARRGLVMLGCGKMGSAMLEGWLNRDLPPSSVHVVRSASIGLAEAAGRLPERDTGPRARRWCFWP